MVQLFDISHEALVLIVDEMRNRAPDSLSSPSTFSDRDTVGD